MKEDIQQLTQLCPVCKELNPKARTNPNINPEQPKTDLGPFKSVGLDMFTWQGKFYLLVVDRMFRYIMVENLAKSVLCRTVTQKFKLLWVTYGHPRQVRYDKGPQFGKEFEEFLEDIHVTPTPSSANNPASNGLAESAVKSAKILLRESIEEK